MKKIMVLGRSQSSLKFKKFADLMNESCKTAHNIFSSKSQWASIQHRLYLQL